MKVVKVAHTTPLAKHKHVAKKVRQEAYNACLAASKNIEDEEALKLCIQKSVEAAKYICEDDSY